MSPRYRVFLSAVTSECGDARKLVASDLRSRGLEVKVQEDFRQEAGADATTLRKLHDCVKDCDRVVAIMGDRSGSFPPPDAAAPFQSMLPDGFARASMTQWEVHFAREFGKRMSIYVASDTFAPDKPAAPNADDDPALQRALRDYLFERKGLDRSPFDSPADLSRLVLKERWPDYSRPPPKSDRFVSIGALFKGRERDMERLRQSLEHGGRAAVTSRAQALHGMGGLGKTRLAIEYGLAHEKDYFGLLFLSGESPAALEASVQGLARVIDIADQAAMTEDARRRAVLDWLRENPGWFLVIDNIDTKAALEAAEGLLSNMSKGDVVVTSRLSNLSGHFVSLDLDVLGENASVDFLNARTDARRRKTATDEADAHAIARELDGLALALEQAGAYISVKRKSFAEYRADWQRQRGHVLSWHSEAVTGYKRSVADAMLLSIAQVSPAGRALLEHLAFLAPEPVPEALLATPIPGFEGDAVDALEEIDGYSLVKRQGDQAAFTMHRLVQDVARRGLTPDEADARCLAALRWLTAAVDPARYQKTRERRDAALALGPHAGAAADHAVSDQALDTARYLLAETGDAFIEAGYLERAARFHGKALGCAQKLVERDPNNSHRQNALAVSYERIGSVLVAQGDLTGALKNFRDFLAIMERLANSDPASTEWQYGLGISNERIGSVQLAQGDLRNALTSYQAKRAIISKLAKSDRGNSGWQRDLSVSQDMIGEVLVAQGDLARALKSFRDSLAIRDRLAKADPGNAGWQRDLSVSYSRIGDVLVAQGNLPEALTSYRDDLAIADRLAKADPGNAGWQRDLSVSYDRVGDVLVAQDNLSEALKNFRDSLAIRDRLEKADPGNAGWQRDLSVSYEKVGDVLVAQGDLAGALNSYRDSLEILDPLAKADPGNVGWQRDLSVSYNRIGEVLVAQGDLAGALKSLRDSLAIADRLAKADPGNAGWQRDLSVSYEKVGDVLVAEGDLAGALKSYRDSLEIRERLAKADPGNAGWQRDLSVSHEKVGDVLVAQGDLAGALNSYRDSLEIRDRLAKADHGNAGWQRDLCISNERLGDTYLKQGNREEARRAFEGALAAYEVLIARGPGDAQSRLFSVVPRARLADLDPPKASEYLAGALAILKPMAAASRLDGTRLQWIPRIEAQIAELKK